MSGSRLKGAAIVRRLAEHLRFSLEECENALDGVTPDARWAGLLEMEKLARTHPLPDPHPALGDVLRAIHGWCGSDVGFTVSSLRSAAQHREKLRLALRPVGVDDDSGRRLGRLLSGQEGRFVEGLTLRVQKRGGKDGNVYVVVGDPWES